MLSNTLQFSPHGDKYILDADYRTGFGIVVPKYFIFDGASIPRICWSAIGVTPFDPDIIEASCYHDWNYYTHQFDRLTIDKQFKKDIAKAVGKMTAWTMYTAVRMFGGGYWNNDDKDIDFLKELRFKLIKEGIDTTIYNFPKLVK